MATTVVFGDEADAHVSGRNNTYATARTTGTDIFNGPSDVIAIGQRFVTPQYRCEQGVVAFDTSTILGTVTGADLTLQASTNLSTTDFTIEARLHDWGATAEIADFVSGADLASKTLLATYDTVDGWTAAAIFTDVAMAASVNQSGFTRLVLASDRHRTASITEADIVAGGKTIIITLAGDTWIPA
jgi:hypothetical protein